jgi:hypothetical protein
MRASQYADNLRSVTGVCITLGLAEAHTTNPCKNESSSNTKVLIPSLRVPRVENARLPVRVTTINISLNCPTTIPVHPFREHLGQS